MFLHQGETQAFLTPVCSEARRSGFIKYAYAALNLVGDDVFRLLESGIQLRGPFEACPIP